MKRLYSLLLLSWVLTSGLASAATFSENAGVYRYRYETTIHFSTSLSPDQYFDKIVRHNSFLIGGMAYVILPENRSSTGAPLRKKSDLKIVEITAEGSRIAVRYAFDGEVVLDEPGLTEFSTYLPTEYEPLEKMNATELSRCSIYAGGNAFVNADLLSTYWNPVASKRSGCAISYQKVKGTLTAVAPQVTYPDYEKLVNDKREIVISAFFGKIFPNASNNPRTGANNGNDSAAKEYLRVLRDLNRLGFEKTDRVINNRDQTTYRETFELKTNGLTIRFETIYGDSVYSQPSMTDFNQRWVKALSENAVVLYSGHSGFWVTGDGLAFYKDMPTQMNPDQYQIIMVNGCQSNYYLYPIHEVKDRNVDLIVNLRSTVANPAATSELVEAIVNWASRGEKAPYSQLVESMNQVGALLGVIEKR